MRAGVVGAGQVGLALASSVAAHPSLELRWVVDIDPRRVGATVDGTGTAVSREPTADVDVVFQTTTSSMRKAAEHVRELLAPERIVVSSCEEMAYPIGGNVDVAAELDRAAVDAGSRVAAAGVNPGFVMEVLALAATGAQLRVDAVRVRRVVDLRTRRQALQEKMGLGDPLGKVQAAIDQGEVGHVGLSESLHLLAAGLGGGIVEVRHHLEPIEAGGVCDGLLERCTARLEGGEELELVLEMSGHAVVSVDEITIEGEPPMTLRIEGGVPGEAGTVGRMINTVGLLRGADPGFHTALDLGLPRHWTGRQHTPHAETEPS